MSILSDKEIRELCTPPKFVITTVIPGHGPNPAVFYQPYPVDSFSYLTEEEIKAKINYMSDVGIKTYRPLTQDEIDNFKPMITPFIDGQVRTIERELTEDEKFSVYNGGDVSNIVYKNNDDLSQLTIKEKIISYGLSSYGYDVRIANEFKIFTNVNSALLDPKNFNDKSFVDHTGDYCIVPPNSFVLARTAEGFVMPPDVTAIVLGKSTYARLGVNCIATPIEAGWAGEIVLEFANTTPLPVKLYANEGAAQLLFFRGDVPCEVSYATRNGKYQNQTGITTARV